MKIKSAAQFVVDHDEAKQTKRLDRMSAKQIVQFFHDWSKWGRPDQMAPEGDWAVWMIMAGRGFGKTRAGAEWVRHIAERDGSARFALVGANFAETRMIMVEGESGLLSIAPPGSRPLWEPSLKRLRWTGGAEARIYSAGEPEGLRGPQHSHAWCDEIAKWMNNAGQALATWDNLKMGLRHGEAPKIVATTTPRPVPLVRQLIKQSSVVVTRGRMVDNHLNLPDAFLAGMAEDYGGTRLGRQELDGELIEDLEGALWTRAMIDACRVCPSTSSGRTDFKHGRADSEGLRISEDRMQTDQGGLASRLSDVEIADKKFVRPELVEGCEEPTREFSRVVIGVDPPASATGDACGIIVAGLVADNQAIVLADCSVEKASPETWARAVDRAADVWRADRVIAEANQGGAMVRSVLHAANITLPVKLVHASRGKVARAEPVAALYENGRVHHAGAFPMLEDELCGLLVGGGYEGPGRSPDRADALVWALTELLLGRKRLPRVR